MSAELEPFLRSSAAPAPGEEEEDGVRVVVAATWRQEVTARDRDTLVTFHAPWCGHCKMMMPVLAKLAAALQVTLTSDSTDNKLPI